jgi:UDP-N-acetylmuramyl pentapeptide synthase
LYREATYLPDLGSGLATIMSSLREGDTVLVKASRGMHLERVVAYLLDTPVAIGGGA